MLTSAIMLIICICNLYINSWKNNNIKYIYLCVFGRVCMWQFLCIWAFRYITHINSYVVIFIIIVFFFVSCYYCRFFILVLFFTVVVINKIKEYNSRPTPVQQHHCTYLIISCLYVYSCASISSKKCCHFLKLLKQILKNLIIISINIYSV